MSQHSKRRNGSAPVNGSSALPPSPPSFPASQLDRQNLKKTIYSKDGSQRIELLATLETAELDRTHSNEAAAAAQAPVYGPELPPSMLREKAVGVAASSSDSSCSYQISAKTLGPADATDLGTNDSASKAERLAQAHADLEKLFREKLTAVMDSSNIEHKLATVKAVEKALKSEDSMVASLDDPAFAMASELKSEIWSILINNMKRMSRKDIDVEILESCVSDASVVELIVNKFRQAFDDYAVASGTGAASAEEAIVKPMQAVSISELSREIKALPSVQERQPSALSTTQSSWEPVPPADALQDLAQRLLDDEAPDCGDDSAKESKSRRKKKNKKKKNKAKTKVAVSQDQAATINWALAAPYSQCETGDDASPMSAQMQPQQRPAPLVPPSDRPQLQGDNHAGKGTASTTREAWMADVASTEAVLSATGALGRAASTTSARRPNDSKAIWSSDRVEEQRQVRKFWLSLSDIERQALVLVEKEVVLARVREHQNFACNCNVCTRKREAIEHELDCLYDCYYEELKESVRREKMRIVIREAEVKARSIISSSVEAITESVIKAEVKANPACDTKDIIKKSVMESVKHTQAVSSLVYSGLSSSAEVDEAVQRAALVASNSVAAKVHSTMQELATDNSGPDASKAGRQPPISLAIQQASIEKAASAIKEWADRAFEYRREFGDEPFRSDGDGDGNDNGNGDGYGDGDGDGEDTIDNNDLFYTESLLGSIDTFPTDSKKFFDMMERLAEYRMRREDALLDNLVDDDDISTGDEDDHDRADGDIEHTSSQRSRRASRHLRRCPDCQGEISESEAKRPYSDSEDHMPSHADWRKARSAARPRYSSTAHGKSSAAGEAYRDVFPDNDDEDIDDYDDDEDDDEGDDDDDLLDDVDDEDEGIDGEDEDDDGDGDDDDDLDPEHAEKQAEEGRRVFQLFAARLFEQRIINAYRERVARERQRKLIEELEEEEKRSKAKEKRKQKKKEREKEKKRHIQQQKEEERLAKEAQLRAEQERKAAAEEKRRKEQERKRREEEARIRKVQEERNRRILEMADKRLEKERLEKIRFEEERLERERRGREEQRRRAGEEEQQRRRAKEAEEREEKRAAEQRKQEGAEQARRQKPEEQAGKAPAEQHAAPAAPAPAAAIKPSTPQAKPAAAPAAAVPTNIDSQQSNADQCPPQLQTPTTDAVPANDKSDFWYSAVTPPRNDVFSSPSMLPRESVKLTPIIENSAAPAYLPPRPSLPMIRPFDTNGAPHAPLPFASPHMRARANSGSQVVMCATAAAPALVPPAPAASVAPSELDAEIMSIVGKVMGSRTLQDELTEGLEWRAEPDGFLDTARFGQPKSSAALSFAVASSAPPISEPSTRRNSVPINRTASEGKVANGSPGSKHSTVASLALSAEVESVYAAYCALEKFRRDSHGPLAASCQDPPSGYHTASDISQMHGMMKESEVWSICMKYSQINPARCHANHATRAVLFASNTTASARDGSSASPVAQTTLEPRLPTLGLASSVPQFAEPRPTPSLQLSVITEDMLSAFSLQPTKASSPLAVSALTPPTARPLHSQPRSPLVPQVSPLVGGRITGNSANEAGGNGAHAQIRSQSQPQTQVQTPTRPQMPIPMPMPMQSQQQPASGVKYASVAHASPTSLFFNPLAMHNPQMPAVHGGGGLHGGAQPFPQAFQHPHPLSAPGLSQTHPGIAAAAGAAGPIVPPPLSMPASGPIFGMPFTQAHIPSGSWSPAKMGDPMRLPPHPSLAHHHVQQQQQHPQHPSQQQQLH